MRSVSGAPKEIRPALERAARERAQALVVLTSPLFSANRRHIAELTQKYRLPTISLFTSFAEAGTLMAYGPSQPEMFRNAARYVDKILRGAKAGELPVERPTKFELVINRKTAKALGLTIPPSLLPVRTRSSSERGVPEVARGRRNLSRRGHSSMSTALGALILVVNTLFIVPVVAAQPSPTVRIGVLSPLSPSAVTSPPFEAFRKALHDLGYVEGEMPRSSTGGPTTAASGSAPLRRSWSTSRSMSSFRVQAHQRRWSRRKARPPFRSSSLALVTRWAPESSRPSRAQVVTQRAS